MVTLDALLLFTEYRQAVMQQVAERERERERELVDAAWRRYDKKVRHRNTDDLNGLLIQHQSSNGRRAPNKRRHGRYDIRAHTEQQTFAF